MEKMLLTILWKFCALAFSKNILVSVYTETVRLLSLEIFKSCADLALRYMVQWWTW